MLYRSTILIFASVAALLAISTAAQAFDETNYPDLKGAWGRTAAPQWVQPGEKMAPLTPEYRAIYDANLAAQARGEPGDAPQWYCLPQGMPMMMSVYDPMEIVVTADVTYILISHVNDSYRRIYTDGRDWPKEAEPTYAGYSIGRWLDESGSGHYDVLEIETRLLKGPRTFDTTGLPLHKDNQTVIRERLHLDKTNRNTLYDEITVSDHALTEPWTVTKRYVRDPNPRPVWISQACAEGNSLARIGDAAYYLSADGYLMPATKGQQPPDLRYFQQTK
jgi:hypothetical protein